MKSRIIKIAAIIIGALALSAGIAVSANPIFFAPTTQTAIATTSPVYMTKGTATSTLTLDTYNSGNPRGAKQAALLVQFTASSTAITLNTNIEYSQDAIDWYQDGGTLVPNYATTSKPYDLSQVNQFQWSFASSTAGLPAIASTTATSTRIIYVNTPTRYVRAVFTDTATGLGASGLAVWGQFVPSKEQQ